MLMALKVYFIDLSLSCLQYMFLDFVVSAPYEVSSVSSQNTGAVYIYYGRVTRDEFESQAPQKVK